MSHFFEIIHGRLFIIYNSSVMFRLKTYKKMPAVLFFNVTAESNKILKIWDIALLPFLSSVKKIFHPASIVNDCLNKGLGTVVRKGFPNQKQNEFLKIIKQEQNSFFAFNVLRSDLQTHLFIAFFICIITN